MQFYGYAKCGTCRKAQKLLDDKGIAYEFIDITVTPPPLEVLQRAAAAKGWQKLFNTSGVQYKELRIKDKIKTMSEAQALALLAKNGRLVKRPIAVSGKKITVGFDPDEYKTVWIA